MSENYGKHKKWKPRRSAGSTDTVNKEWFSMITAMREFAQECEEKVRKNIIQIASKAKEIGVKVDYDLLGKDPAYQNEICNLLG